MVPDELKFKKCGAFLYMTEGHLLNQDDGIPSEFGKADS